MGKMTEEGRGGLVTDPKPISSKLKKNISFLYIYMYMSFRKQSKVSRTEILEKENDVA